MRGDRSAIGNVLSQLERCAPGLPGRSFRLLAPALALAGLVGLAGTAAGPVGAAQVARVRPAGPGREQPFVTRPLELFIGKRWIGDAIAYGPHRDGQRPGGPSPTKAELRQDLHLMAKHWGLLRLYGSTGSADSILQVIREDRLDLKVLLGVWIDAEERRDSTGAAVEAFPEAVAANRRETEAAVRLAAEYPASVVAISVGNETQIDWSSHRVPQELLVAFIREVRARTQVPVTTADDYNFWNKPGSEPVAAELDFVMTHFHPLWNGIQIEGALDWSKRIYADVRAAHPGRTVVIGETGWATQKHDAGEQATLIKGRPGEAEQKIFHDELTAWVDAGRIPAFWFEAFDENWKGGPSPDDVEKHWGLYRADRTPKPAMAGKPAR